MTVCQILGGAKAREDSFESVVSLCMDMHLIHGTMLILLGARKKGQPPQLHRYGTVRYRLKVVNLRLTPDSRADSPFTDRLEPSERMGCHARWETGVLCG